MDYLRLGSSGLRVSRICLGVMTYGTPKWRPWVLDEQASRPFIKRALELGINFFDTADMYSDGVSEEVLGRALKDFTQRDQVVIATKGFWPTGTGPNDKGLSRKHLFDAIDASLRRLGVDYVDLYQIHRFDPDTPIAETVEALHDIVKGGRRDTLVRRACHRGSLRKCSTPRIVMDGRGSYRCRTTTTLSTEKKNARCFHSAGKKASV
jgi:aryl-alcohol dehydrogenase-like predicted oxidoreductase